MTLIDNKFNIKEIVYLKTDDTQSPRIVTGMNVRETSITYGVSCGTQESWHYDFELSRERDVMLTSNN